MRQTRYLVCYDISNAQRLRSVHKCVLSYGRQLQYSVYVCDLTETQLVAMRFELRGIMKQNQDSVILVSLGTAYDESSIEVLGKPRLFPSEAALIV